MAGPKADPSRQYSRHRDRKATRNLLVLPSECTLPPPKMPVGREWTREERRLWRELWTSPQATQWDDSYSTSVAAYIVHVSAVLSGQASAWQGQEMRHLGDQLGLTPRGLLALGWALDAGTAPAPVVPLRGA
jgi:hypothetical protein